MSKNKAPEQFAPKLEFEEFREQFLKQFQAQYGAGFFDYGDNGMIEHWWMASETPTSAVTKADVIRVKRGSREWLTLELEGVNCHVIS